MAWVTVTSGSASMLGIHLGPHLKAREEFPEGNGIGQVHEDLRAGVAVGAQWKG